MDLIDLSILKRQAPSFTTIFKSNDYLSFPNTYKYISKAPRYLIINEDSIIAITNKLTILDHDHELCNKQNKWWGILLDFNSNKLQPILICWSDGCKSQSLIPRCDFI